MIKSKKKLYKFVSIHMITTAWDYASVCDSLFQRFHLEVNFQTLDLCFIALETLRATIRGNTHTYHVCMKTY